MKNKRKIIGDHFKSIFYDKTMTKITVFDPVDIAQPLELTARRSLCSGDWRRRGIRLKLMTSPLLSGSGVGRYQESFCPQTAAQCACTSRARKLQTRDVPSCKTIYHFMYLQLGLLGF